MIMLLIIVIFKLHIMNTDCIGCVGDGGKNQACTPGSSHVSEGTDRAPRLRQRDSGSPEDMRLTPHIEMGGSDQEADPSLSLQGQGQGWLVFDPQCSAKQ